MTMSVQRYVDRRIPSQLREAFVEMMNTGIGRRLAESSAQRRARYILDPTGKLAGRGAYLCDEPDCWHRAAQGKALDKALKVELGGADRAVLRARADELETREMDA